MAARSICVGVVCAAAGGALAQPSTLQRQHDPVILTGAALPDLLGAPVGTIVAFRYEAGWQQVPVQVDERNVVDFGTVYNLAPVGVTTLAYTDPTTYTGPDPDPAFDADDELVFLAADAGDGAAPGAGRPAGVLPGTGVVVTVTDPLDGGTAYVYLFETDGALPPDAGRDDVTYTFDLLAGSYIPDYDTLSGPNPENSIAVTDHYRVHFADRWVRDETNVYTGGASGVDILDRHKNLFGPGICTRTEDTFSAGEGAFVTNRDGPIRAIRSYLGANSGPLTQREHFFYPQREDIATHLRVHAIAGIMDLFDYSPLAPGMTYFNDLNPAGAFVDGVPDAVTPGPIAWEMITGLQGTLIMPAAFQTNIPGFASTSYYSDAAMPGVTQCTGDLHEYATSGWWVNQGIPNTDPTLPNAFIMVGRRVIYYDAPNQTTELAELRADQASRPLIASAEAYAPCPWDCGDGDGTVGVVDFLALLAEWGQSGTPCDADGGGVGVTDFLALLANWGPCP